MASRPNIPRAGADVKARGSRCPWQQAQNSRSIGAAQLPGLIYVFGVDFVARQLFRGRSGVYSGVVRDSAVSRQPPPERSISMKTTHWLGFAFTCCIALSQLAHHRTLAADTAVEEKKETKNTAVVPVFHAGTTAKHEKINERAKQGDVELLFIGDSITEGWAGRGKEVWDKYYGNRKAMNAGVGGDRTQHVLWRLDNGNVDGIKPKLAVIMIGTNNSNGKDNTAEEIADGIKVIVKEVREKLPETKILLLGIFPRGPRPMLSWKRSSPKVERKKSKPPIYKTELPLRGR